MTSEVGLKEKNRMILQHNHMMAALLGIGTGNVKKLQCMNIDDRSSELTLPCQACNRVICSIC